MQNLILSRLDYCNSLLGGTNQSSIAKLQRVQNAACRFIFNLRKQESCKEYRYNLHWLPFAQRIDFKILTFVHKIVYDLDIPNHLKDLIFVQEKNSSKRSENQWKLEVESFRNCYGKRAFSVYGPRKWNAVPHYLRKTSDHKLFCKELKTFLFSSCYRNNFSKGKWIVNRRGRVE